MLGCMLRERGEEDTLYMLGLSHSHYGLTGLYVITKSCEETTAENEYFVVNVGTS